MKDIMRPVIWDLNSFPVHMRADADRHNQNVKLKKKLCTKCTGTGNQMYSMYKKCSKCNGTGVKK